MEKSGRTGFRRTIQPLLVAAVCLFVMKPECLFAGAQARGGLGRYYLKVAYADSSADTGYDSDGNSSGLASQAFLDQLTARFARNGEYNETAFRIYLEFGILKRLDLLFQLDWKEIETSFDLEILGIEFPVEQKNSGAGDGMIGLKTQVLAAPIPMAVDVRYIFPNYPTSVEELNLETINSLDDKVPLGNGTQDLQLGLSASTGSLIPHGFGDVRIAYVLSDLESRDFSDRFLWEVKAGGSYRGFGGAAFLDGLQSMRNGSAPDKISQDNLLFDPSKRVVILNDQAWTRVGAQAWYNFHGLSLELTFSQVLSGQNIPEIRMVEIGISFQR